jgi:hypothetical protein
MIGLDSYIENAEAFANKIYSTDFVESIYQENDVVNNQITDAFLKLSKGEQKIIGNFVVAKNRGR